MDGAIEIEGALCADIDPNMRTAYQSKRNRDSTLVHSICVGSSVGLVRIDAVKIRVQLIHLSLGDA